jgi:hypothetical protein
MILLSILGLALGAVAQMASLWASSKFATANASDLGVMPLAAARTSVRDAGAADPGWTAFMRGM